MGISRYDSPTTIITAHPTAATCACANADAIGGHANHPEIRLRPTSMPSPLAPSMFANASATCSFTGHATGARTRPAQARTATSSTVAATSSADQTIPLYSPSQKCDTMPLTPSA